MIERISSSARIQPQAAERVQTEAAKGFGAAFQREIQKTQTRQSVEFSKHARDRVQERGIEITPQLLDQLAGGVEKAQEKGARNILAMDAETAYIINIPRARVITAISQSEMKENVFTNIDGAVFL